MWLWELLEEEMDGERGRDLSIMEVVDIGYGWLEIEMVAKSKGNLLNQIS